MFIQPIYLYLTLWHIYTFVSNYYLILTFSAYRAIQSADITRRIR